MEEEDSRCKTPLLKRKQTSETCGSKAKKTADGEEKEVQTGLVRSPSSPVVCHATGFYPDRVVVFWRRDGQELHEQVDPGEVLPNHDGTFQLSVDLNLKAVPQEDWGRYECVVQLKGIEDISTPLDPALIRTNWVGRIPDTWGDHAGPSHLVAVVGFIFFQRRLINWRDEGEDEDAVDSEDEAESGDGWSRGCPEGFYSRWRRKTGHGEDRASGGDPPEESDLTAVRRLFEREASKQEQRWRSVQCSFYGFAAAYLDDIVVYSVTWEDHLRHLEDVLQRIQRGGADHPPEDHLRHLEDVLQRIQRSGADHPPEDHLRHLEDVLRHIQRAGLTTHPLKCAMAQEEVVNASDARVGVTSLWIISSSCSSEYIDMKALIGLLLLVFGHGVSSVLHSMHYFYTASSGLSTFPEFVGVGMLDGVQINYYDSNTQKKVLKQDWMEQLTREDPDYLERETGNFLGSQQWFKANIVNLKKLFNQTGGTFISTV
ncbi:unnamed protein product [Boreogadus saida]